VLILRTEVRKEEIAPAHAVGELPQDIIIPRQYGMRTVIPDCLAFRRESIFSSRHVAHTLFLEDFRSMNIW